MAGVDLRNGARATGSQIDHDYHEVRPLAPDTSTAGGAQVVS